MCSIIVSRAVVVFGLVPVNWAWSSPDHSGICGEQGEVFESAACVLKLEKTLQSRDMCREGVWVGMGVHICGSESLE